MRAAAVEIVLADLARFCRSGASSLHLGADGRVDPLMTAALEGRREVLNYIRARLRATDRDIEETVDREARLVNRRYATGEDE